MLCEWDPHIIPILAEVGGKVRFEDIVEGETMRIEKDPSGHIRRMIMEHKGDLHPQIVIEDADGQDRSTSTTCPERAHIEVDEGADDHGRHRCWPRRRAKSAARRTSPAVCRASPKSSRPASPKDPAVIAEIDGKVELLEREAPRQADDHRQAARAASSASTSSRTASTSASTPATTSRPATPLVDGPLVPHDILRISGEEAVQQYLLREIQNVYRSQRVEIDDKHIEIIVAQMLRKVKVETSATPACCPASVIDKFEFRGRQRASSWSA